MKHSQSLLTTLLTTLLAAASPAYAQSHGHGHDSHAPATQVAQAAPLPQVEALVRTVDKSAKKITLKHGEIPNLDMGPMTMVFQVADPALLDRVKAGDTVRFTVDKIKGAYTVLTLEPVKN